MPEFWTFAGIAPDRPALIRPGAETVTYGELDLRAQEWADRLLRLTNGQRVMAALDFETSVTAIAAYLGCLRAGCPVLLLEPGQMAPGSRLQDIWTPEIHIRRENGDLAAVAAAPGAPRPAPHPDLRLLLSTSGSTGDPKLVRLSGRNIDSNARSIAEYLAVTPEDRAATTLPLFYSYGMSVVNSYLSAGAALVLIDHSVTDPAFWRSAADAGVTSLAMVPHQFELLEHSGFTGEELPGLRYVTQAGGKLAPRLIRHFAQMGRDHGWDMVVMYGQTEAAPRISYVPPEALPEAAETIGRAVPGGRLWLADEQGNEITAPGIAGELFYAGPNVMMGYAVERADLARGAEVEVLQTGDIAERTAEGLFRIVGRLKRFVKLFGLRLSLDQIEALLRDQGIQAQAVAVEDRLVLLHTDPAAGPRAREIVSAEYELPLSEIHVAPLAQMPLLASGKPDHRALRDIAGAVLRDLDSSTPRISIAEALASATRSKTVGPNDSFTSLGGDSLGYLQVQMALESAIGRCPPNWENMPLSALEAHAAQAAGTDGRRFGSAAADVLLRVLGIGLVVAQHATDYSLYGGTWILILLMGYSAGRFQLRQIEKGHVANIAAKMFYPIVPLYLCILLAYQLLRSDVPLPDLAFFSNYVIPTESSFLGVMWFVSLYVQFVLLLMLMAAVRPVREALARDAWRTVLALLLGVLLLEGIVLALSPPHRFEAGQFAHLVVVDAPMGHVARRGLLECLPIFLFGWLIQAAGTRRRRMLALLAGVPVLALFFPLDADWMPVVWLGFAALVLFVGVELPMPAPLATLLKRIATASLFVYLTHETIVHVLRYATGFFDRFGNFPTMLMALALSFGLGIVLKSAFDLLDRKIQSVGTSLRSSLRPRPR